MNKPKNDVTFNPSRHTCTGTCTGTCTHVHVPLKNLMALMAPLFCTSLHSEKINQCMNLLKTDVCIQIIEIYVHTNLDYNKFTQDTINLEGAWVHSYMYRPTCKKKFTMVQTTVQAEKV